MTRGDTCQSKACVVTYHRPHGPRDPAADRRTASPISRPSSTRAATRSGAGARISGSAAGTGSNSTAGENREAPARPLDGRRTGPRAGPRRLAGRRRRRLGEPRSARGLRAARLSKVLAPLDETPVWSIVCFVVGARVARPGRRGRAPRRGDRLRPRPRRDDPRGLPGRRRGRRADPVGERLPRHARDVRAGRLRGRRAPPVDKGSPNATPRPIVRKTIRPRRTLTRRRPTSSVAVRPSSSVEVDTARGRAPRLPSGAHVARPRLAHMEAVSE